VRFSIGHELGHFYIDEHRQALVLRKTTHQSFSEFVSNHLVERQADAFASGLLLPKYLVNGRINLEPEPTLHIIRSFADEFEVSFMAAMIRWIQVTHFPCAAISIANGKIEWGFVAEAFRSVGIKKAAKNSDVRSPTAIEFLRKPMDQFREASGTGFATHWLEGDTPSIPVREFYVTIPYRRSAMAFLVADEGDLPTEQDDSFDDD
jgi:hypothetical protein